MNSKGFESFLVSGGYFGASWGVLGASWGRLARQNRLGAVLEPSWERLGGVLGASCGTLGGFLGRLVGLLGRLGASWRHLVRDFHTKGWLHISLASERSFLMDFHQFFLPTSTSRIMLQFNSRLRKTFRSKKSFFEVDIVFSLIFNANMPPFWFPKSTKIASWRPLWAS